MKEKYNIIDSFFVQLNKYSFHCEKQQAVDDSDAEIYNVWHIKFSEENSMINGSINLPFNYARTAVFQVIDGFKL